MLPLSLFEEGGGDSHNLGVENYLLMSEIGYICDRVRKFYCQKLPHICVGEIKLGCREES